MPPEQEADEKTYICVSCHRSDFSLGDRESVDTGFILPRPVLLQRLKTGDCSRPARKNAFVSSAQRSRRSAARPRLHNAACGPFDRRRPSTIVALTLPNVKTWSARH
jgi:hypothetical protein